jgi:hypothetical protein
MQNENFFYRRSSWVTTYLSWRKSLNTAAASVLSARVPSNTHVEHSNTV